MELKLYSRLSLLLTHVIFELLIVPYGIEIPLSIYQLQFQMVLLIVPYGIEI